MTAAIIAAEVAAALAEVGTATGAGPLVGSLKKPAGTPANPPQNPFAPVAPATPPAPAPVGIALDTFGKRHHDMWQIVDTDVLVMMEATGPVPEPGDVLAIGGVDHAVIAVATLAPGGVALMYEVQCRR